MTRRYPRRIVTCAAALLVLIAVAAPAAHAATNGQLNVGATLLDQPKGQPWAVNLVLGANLFEGADTTGPVSSITKDITFQFPKAKVNGSAFKTCAATEADFVKKAEGACPSASIIGTGTAIVDAIGLPFNAKLWIYNGTGTDAARKILLFAHVTDPGVEVNLPLGGTLKRTSGAVRLQARPADPGHRGRRRPVRRDQELQRRRRQAHSQGRQEGLLHRRPDLLPFRRLAVQHGRHVQGRQHGERPSCDQLHADGDLTPLQLHEDRLVLQVRRQARVAVLAAQA